MEVSRRSRRRDRMAIDGRRDEPMSDEWVSVLVAWLPFILLILVFAAMARWQGMRSRGPSGHSLIELYEQQVAETRCMNATLERVAVALEQHANRARP
jgi:ATP-dependent Zn protease